MTRPVLVMMQRTNQPTGCFGGEEKMDTNPKIVSLKTQKTSKFHE